MFIAQGIAHFCIKKKTQHIAFLAKGGETKLFWQRVVRQTINFCWPYSSPFNSPTIEKINAPFFFLPFSLRCLTPILTCLKRLKFSSMSRLLHRSYASGLLKEKADTGVCDLSCWVVRKHESGQNIRICNVEITLLYFTI